MNKKIVKTCIIIFILLMVGFSYSCNRMQDLDALSDESESDSFIESSDLTEQDGENAIATQSHTIVTVYVCGQVSKPDVYAFDSESRIVDAIDMAGGFTESAATDYLNLAETLSDGLKIYVPSIQEYESEYKQTDVYGFSQSSLININTATKEELMTLTGIGESRAEDIISYRQTHGRFETKEDIMNVSGIKTASYEKIKDDITV